MTTRPPTRCVHGGTPPDAQTGALVPPLIQSTTYAWKDLAHPPPITYARSGNPTVQSLERRLTVLEGGATAVAFASGLAATDALLRAAPEGARIVAARHLYGGTTRLLHRFHTTGRRIDIVDATNPDALAAALEEPAGLVFVETPSNPTLEIVDLRLAARLAKRTGAWLVVDNTFLTPLHQRPLELGADIALHSTTKYLEGHDATLGGALVFADRHAGTEQNSEGSLAERVRWIRKATGAVLAPFEAWLTLQGIKTLHLRTRQSWASAGRIARRLRSHPAVHDVRYPGLPNHPGHRIHRSQATGDGGIVTLNLGSLDAARRFAESLRVFRIAENLGATESLATHPATMTHADLPPERRRADGIPDGLLRLSLGVEDPDDLAADVEQALARTNRLEAAA